MKIAIAAVLTVVVGLGAIVGVYQFRESRMTPTDLDALRQAERKLAEAEDASAALDVVETEETTSAGESANAEDAAPEAIEMAQAEDATPPAREWKQIDTPDYDAQTSFHVKFACSMGDFVVEFQPNWAPNGVKRIHELVDMKFFDDCRFFRVIDGFMAQFGIHGDPATAAKWGNMNIPDDPAKESNQPGYVTFAMGGPNTRSTQLFLNFRDNSQLDNRGFPPVGKIVDGMDALDKIYRGYGGGPSEGGQGPRQDLIQSGGNQYLNEFFPKLDYVKKARFVEPAEETADDAAESEAA